MKGARFVYHINHKTKLRILEKQNLFLLGVVEMGFLCVDTHILECSVDQTGLEPRDLPACLLSVEIKGVGHHRPA